MGDMKHLVRLGAALALTAIAVLAVLPFAPGSSIGIPSSCTVGLMGAAVSITYDGVGADSVCAQWEGRVTDGGSWYRYAGGTDPGGAVICQGKRGGVTVTVRDQGALNLYGSSVCEAIFR